MTCDCTRGGDVLSAVYIRCLVLCVCVYLESDQLHEDIRSGKDTGPRDDNAPSNGEQQSNYCTTHYMIMKLPFLFSPYNEGT